MEKTPMDQSELLALEITVKTIGRMVKECDVQETNYPYLVATESDLQRVYGKELISRVVDSGTQCSGT